MTSLHKQTFSAVRSYNTYTNVYIKNYIKAGRYHDYYHRLSTEAIYGLNTVPDAAQ